jgi:hypothetical protein
MIRGQEVPAMKRRNVGLVILTGLLGISLVISGCASGNAKPLPGFESVHIQSYPRPPDGLHAWPIYDTEARVENIDKGEATGAGVGGALAAASCIALVPFAAPQCSAMGASGSAALLATGSVETTHPIDVNTPEKRQWVEYVLRQVEDRREFFSEMRNAVRTAVPEDRQVEADKAAMLIIVGPKSTYLLQDGSGLALRMTGRLTAQWNRHWRTPTTVKKSYDYTTAGKPIADWLRDDGAGFEAGFTECISGIVDQMKEDLEKTMH